MTWDRIEPPPRSWNLILDPTPRLWDRQTSAAVQTRWDNNRTRWDIFNAQDTVWDVGLAQNERWNRLNGN